MESSIIAEALGGRKVLGRAIKTPSDLARLIRKGLPTSSVKVLAERLAVGSTVLSGKLGIPQRTLTRRLSQRARLTSDSRPGPRAAPQGRRLLSGLRVETSVVPGPALSTASDPRATGR